MKKIAFAIAALASATGAFAQSTGEAYQYDAAKKLVKNNYGECVRTGFWTPERAIAECEPGMAKPAPVAAPVAVVAPAPVAAPAPAPRAVPAPAPVVVAPAPVVVAPAPAPAPKPAPAPRKKIAIEAATSFAVGKAVLTPAGKAAIDKELIAKLGDFSKIDSITVEGHADPMGKEAANKVLSQKRADAVKAYLVQKGVKHEINAVGKGSSDPVPNVNCDAKLPKAKLTACYAPHRRIEVDVKGEAK